MKVSRRIALQRELMVEVNDGILFPLLEQVITGHEDEKTGTALRISRTSTAMWGINA
jgi:hypothetical protein